MTTLSSEDSADCIVYTLNLSESTASFRVKAFETIRANLGLIDDMMSIFIEENISNVYFNFSGRGKRKVKTEKIVDSKTVYEYKEVFNNVCYLPNNNTVKLLQTGKTNDQVYLCPLNNFLTFYKANMNYIITDDLIKLSRLVEKPDVDGFVTVNYGKKKERSKVRKVLKSKINHISKNNRNKSTEQINAIKLTESNVENVAFNS